MEKVVVTILSALSIGALACFLFFRVFSKPTDKVGMINGYDVEYDDFAFASNQESHFYQVGDEVRLCYNTIATDTDYSFSVIGVDDYNIDYSDAEGYIITFKMPNNKVTVSYSVKNSMVFEQ